MDKLGAMDFVLLHELDFKKPHPAFIMGNGARVQLHSSFCLFLVLPEFLQNFSNPRGRFFWIPQERGGVQDVFIHFEGMTNIICKLISF